MNHRLWNLMVLLVFSMLCCPASAETNSIEDAAFDPEEFFLHQGPLPSNPEANFVLDEPLLFHFDEVDVVVRRLAADPCVWYTGVECRMNMENTVIRFWDGIVSQTPITYEDMQISNQQPLCFVSVVPYYDLQFGVNSFDFAVENNTVYVVQEAKYSRHGYDRLMSSMKNADKETINVRFQVDLILCSKGDIQNKTYEFSIACPVQPVHDYAMLQCPRSYPEYNEEIEWFELFQTSLDVHLYLNLHRIDYSVKPYWSIAIVDREGNAAGQYHVGIPNRLYYLICDPETDRVVYQETWKREGNMYISAIK